MLTNVVMESVTFTPHYTLRAQSSGTESSLNIRYHARISNTSGEDWNDVSLAISTAQASETTVIPCMTRWTVDFRAPYVKPDYRMQFKGGAKRSMAPPMQMPMQQQMPAGYGIAVGGTSELENEAWIERDMTTSAAEVSEGITSTFMIPGKQTIKDGEKSHTVIIRDLVLEGKFANICVPKIKDVAYLQVRFVHRPF
jgi:uncharacterized protein (TIGR02231 family)